ncbi:MAG: antitoxin VbhA family protein [Burkholderiales bacterium]|nr:antitoxin VbhA family protein [Burkholderiales bacterium]
MSVETSEEDRKKFVEQTLASAALEGFEPEPDFRTLLDRYIKGELTIAEVREVTDQVFGLK